MIPVHAPEWTNHNESDPGITLIELFAYLTEMMIYRLNRVTDANRCAFLTLIDGIKRTPSTQHAGMILKGDSKEEVSLTAEVRAVVLNLREQDRAVTCEDFVRLAKAASPRVERAYCVPQRDLTANEPYKKAEGHVSVVIYLSDDELIKTVSKYLDDRRLLTTRVHVVGPRVLTIAVHLRIHLKPDAKAEGVLQAVTAALEGFFNPHNVGPDKQGWPFGRSVYVSEIYRLLNGIPGIDFVTRAKAINKVNKPFEILTAYDSDADAALDVSSERRVTFPKGQAGGELVAINLQPDELVNFSIKKSHLEYEQAAEKD